MRSYLLFWERAFDANGVASRKQYWLALLMNAVVTVLISILLHLLETMFYERHMWDVANAMEPVTLAVLGIYIIVSVFPGITLTMRRLHDHNFSGALILIGLVPVLGSLILLVFLCLGTIETDNRWRMMDIQRGYVTESREDPTGEWQYEDYVYHLEYEEAQQKEEI